MRKLLGSFGRSDLSGVSGSNKVVFDQFVLQITDDVLRFIELDCTGYDNSEILFDFYEKITTVPRSCS